MDSPPSCSILDSPSPPGEVCIVSTDAASVKIYYAVFIVDFAASPIILLDADCIHKLSPKILIDLNLSLHSMRDPDTPYSFCVLNSTLYLFQKGRPAIYTPRRFKSVYAYDLSPYLGGKDPAKPLVVDKTMLCLQPEMLSPKNYPIAVPTPDGKRILVFSAEICYDPIDIGASEIDEIDFELFYPPLENKSKNKNYPWKKLPSLHQYLVSIDAPPKDLDIESYGFITRSTFLIQIKFGVFTIDIDTPVPIWKKLDIHVPFNGPVFGIEADRLWLTNAGPYDVSKGYNDMFNPISSPFISSRFGKDFEYGEPIESKLHTISDKRGKLFGIVRSLLGIDERTHYAHMILDVYRIDLDKYRNDKKINVRADACLETSLIKTFRFIVDGGKCLEFSPRCLSPIPVPRLF